MFKLSFILLTMVLFSLSESRASFPLNKKSEDPVSRFIVGFKGGVNFSAVRLIHSYSVFGSSTAEKDYAGLFRNPGYQYGFIGEYNISGRLSFSIQPTFYTYSYNYENRLEWIDASNSSNRLVAVYLHRQNLKYIGIPVYIHYKYSIGRFFQYVQGGLFYEFLTGASQEIDMRQTLYTLDDTKPLNSDNIAGDASSLFIRSKIGALAGIGAGYNFGILILTLDVNYHRNFNNMVDEKNRYNNQQFSGHAYDIPDDFSLNHIVVNLSLKFPLLQPNWSKSLKCRT